MNDAKAEATQQLASEASTAFNPADAVSALHQENLSLAYEASRRPLEL